jgi:uncharacterized protein YjiS (DUF1127 family)
MALGHAIGNLGFFDAREPRRPVLMPYLLKLEAWLDSRSSAHALYGMDERTLRDLALSQADIDGLNTDGSRVTVRRR